MSKEAPAGVEGDGQVDEAEERAGDRGRALASIGGRFAGTIAGVGCGVGCAMGDVE
jgi:hypothetical protein